MSWKIQYLQVDYRIKFCFITEMISAKDSYLAFIYMIDDDSLFFFNQEQTSESQMLKKPPDFWSRGRSRGFVPLKAFFVPVLESLINERLVIIKKPSGRFHIRLHPPYKWTFLFLPPPTLCLKKAGSYFQMKASVNGGVLYDLNVGASWGKHSSTQCHITFLMVSHNQAINYETGTKPKPEDLNTKRLSECQRDVSSEVGLFQSKIEREKTPSVSKAAELLSMQRGCGILTFIP